MKHFVWLVGGSPVQGQGDNRTERKTLRDQKFYARSLDKLVDPLSLLTPQG